MAQLGPKLRCKAENKLENGLFQDVGLVRLCLLTSKPFGFQLALKHIVAPKWVQFAGRLPRWAEVGANWSEVGALLAEVGAMLRPCWIETVHLESFGPICKMRNSTQRGTGFWRLTRANMRPHHQLKLYKSDRSVWSHPLLNYHASAPSGQANFSRYSSAYQPTLLSAACVFS